MKYFVNEAERKASGSTYYFEFQKGKFHNECWLPDSLSIHVDLFDELKLYDLISSVVPSFDYYGLTEIDRNGWKGIVKQACVIGGKTAQAIKEANEWALKTFSEASIITICGV